MPIDTVEETPLPVRTPEETKVLSDLYEYLQPEHTPWRKDYLEIVRQCHDFKELRQWEDIDRGALEAYGVPAIPVDRINRGLDTIKGIRVNTGAKRRITKREMGDDKTATFLDKVCDFVEYNSNYSDAEDEAFDSLLDAGIGIVKDGYDPEGNGGTGEFWSEPVNIEDFWCSPFKKKDLSDISWACHRQMLNPEEAYIRWPDKAGVLKGLVQQQTSEWEALKTGNKATPREKDYGSSTIQSDPKYSIKNGLVIDEFWVKRVVPITKVMALTVNPGGTIAPQVRVEAADYQPQEGEQTRVTSQIRWIQYIIAGGETGILVSQQESKYNWHPFTAEIVERKKNGMPRGYIEPVIPHQIRINLAWGQKVAYNNKSIKTPLTLKGNVTPDVIDNAVHQAAFGAVLILPTGVEAVANMPLPLNTQAIEEGEQARRDMDFSAAATEESLRGVGDATSSGVKFSLKQSASMTPLNKWVKAEQRMKLSLWRKRLEMIVSKMSPERMVRIVGEEMMMKLMQPTQDPLTGAVSPGLQLPLNIDVTQYDVMVDDQAVSDFNKQQSFNAAMALHGGGFIMDAKYMIGNAPIKNPEEALASHERARADVMLQLMAQVESLQNELKATQKMVPKTGNQTANAQRGRNESQTGRRSMVGGQGPQSPLGM